MKHVICKELLRDPHDGTQVDVDRHVPGFRLHPRKRLVARHPCVMNDDIDAPVLLLQLTRNTGGRVLIGDVHEKDRAPNPARNLAARPVVRRPIEADDMCSLGGHKLCGRFAYASGSACHQCHLPIEGLGLGRAFALDEVGALNVKLAGSHAGVSIGEDGPSQMALEDLAMMRAVPGCAVLYPCDAVSAARLVEAAAGCDGMVYIRTSRPKTPVIYAADDEFAIGGSKVLRASPDDAAAVVAAGVTLFEALRAHDALAVEGIPLRVIDAYSVQPIDRRTLLAAARRTGGRLITVEDHYAAGGLGDAVSDALAADGVVVERLAVREVPHSGRPEELLERFGISASCIAAAVRRQVGAAATAAAGRA